MILKDIDKMFGIIKSLENDITDQQVLLNAANGSIKRLEANIEKNKNRITKVEEQIEQIDGQIESAKKEKEALENKKSEILQNPNQSLIVQPSKRRTPFDLFRFLFFGIPYEKSDVVTVQNTEDLDKKIAEKQSEVEMLERQKDSCGTEKSKIKEDITKNEKLIKDIERNAVKFKKELDRLQESVREISEAIRNLYNKNKDNKNKKYGDLKSRGINSFEELKDIFGEIVIGEDDLQELSKSSRKKRQNNAFSEYYIFTTRDSIKISSEGNDVYSIDSGKIPKTSKIAILVPMNEIESRSVVAFDSNNIILTDEFTYPKGTVCLIPQKNGAELKEIIRQNPNFSNVIVIEYEGSEIGEYPRYLVKLLEGNDPKNWNRELFIKKYPYLKDAKDNYFEEQAVNNILQLIAKLNKCQISRFDYFLYFLKIAEQQAELGTEEVFKRALLSEKRSVQEQIKYIVNRIKNKGYIFSEDGIKLISDIFSEKYDLTEKEANKIEQTALISNKQYRAVVVRNIRNYIRERDTQISKITMFRNIFFGIFAIDNGILDIEKETADYYTEKEEKAKTEEAIREWTRLIQSSEDEEERTNNKSKKKQNSRILRQEKRQRKVYFDEEYTREIDLWLNKIGEICENSKLGINVNWTLKQGTLILANTMPNINEMDEYSQSSNIIVFENQRVPLKKRLNVDELNKKETFLKHGESRIVALVRMINVCNRLAHTYKYLLENYIFDFFYEDNQNLEKKEVIKSREFKEIAQALQNYCVINKETNLPLQSINASWNRLTNFLTSKSISKWPTADFLDSISQLIDLRDRCYEEKNKLILYTIPKMKKANKKGPDSYSYGIVQTTTEGTEKIDNVLYINLPGYGQFGFHIISPEILNDIYSEYDSELPIIKSDYDQKKGRVQPPIPTMGLSEELNDYIQENGLDVLLNKIAENGLNVLLNKIAENGEKYEDTRKDIFNVLLNYGKPIDEIKDALKIFDNQYGGHEPRD